MPLHETLSYGLLVLSFVAGLLTINRIIQILAAHYFYGTTPAQEIAYTLQWWGLGRLLPLPGDRIIGIDLRFLTVTKRGGIWFWRLGRIGGSFYIARN